MQLWKRIKAGGRYLPNAPSKAPPELAEIVAEWPTLPEAVMAGILAMVRASQGLAGRRGDIAKASVVDQDLDM